MVTLPPLSGPASVGVYRAVREAVHAGAVADLAAPLLVVAVGWLINSRVRLYQGDRDG